METLLCVGDVCLYQNNLVKIVEITKPTGYHLFFVIDLEDGTEQVCARYQLEKVDPREYLTKSTHFERRQNQTLSPK